MDSNNSSRMEQVSFFYSLTFIFKAKTFGILLFFRISRKWREIEKHYYCHHIGSQIFAMEWRYCKCCTYRHWPILLRSQYLENGKHSSTTFTKVDTSHLMAPLSFTKVDTSHRMTPLSLKRLILAIDWHNYKCCTSLPWPIFSRLWNFWKYINVQYLENGEASEKCSSITEVDILYRMA